MKRVRFISALAVAASICAAGAAHSAVVSINNVTALWFDGNPAANVTYYGSNTVSPYSRWGTGGPGGQQSGYDFDVANLPISFTVPPSPSPNQVLGTFKHQNFPINAGSSINSIKLRITADVFVGTSLVGDNLQFEYGFSHWETDNGAQPCANGGANGAGVNINGCADRVIANWLATSDSFTVGLDTFTLNVIGFSLDSAGTNPFNSFWTAEGRENVAYLVGNVALKSDLVPANQTPEPATLALVGAALASIAASRRRRIVRA